MSNFFNFIDKYKFGVLAVVGAYMALFIYLQMQSVPYYFEIKSFTEGARLQLPKEEIEIKPENIEVPADFQAGKVTATARDMNDDRKRSDDNWSASKSAAEAEKQVREEEQQMFEAAGGEAKRKAIREADEKRKRDQKNSTSDPKVTSNPGKANAVSGNVMVEWSLLNRSPHLNNEWHVRNPGYTCGQGAAGRVSVQIKVGKDGRVSHAVYDATGSANADPCMIEQALKYAKMSRFDYSANAAELQSGKIIYTFIAQ